MKLIEAPQASTFANRVQMVGPPNAIEGFKDATTAITLGYLSSLPNGASEKLGESHDLLYDLASPTTSLRTNQIAFINSMIADDAIEQRREGVIQAGVHHQLGAATVRRELDLLEHFEWVNDDILLTAEGYRAELHQEKIAPSVFPIEQLRTWPFDVTPAVPLAATHFVSRYAMPMGIDESAYDPEDFIFTYTIFTGAPRAVFGTVENDNLFVALP